MSTRHPVQRVESQSTSHLTTDSPTQVPFEVAVRPEADGKSIFATEAIPTIANLDRYRVPLDKMVETARRLQHE